MRASFRLASGNNYPGGLRGRVNPATGESYAAWIYPADGVIKLFRVVAWNIDTPGLTLLTQASVGTIAPGVFHTLALTFQGSAIGVAYDGASVIQATDSAFAAGAVALDVSNQPIDFDDVVVDSDPMPAGALFGDDFRGGTLANWTASPLGLLANWDASSLFAHYNGGGHTQLWAGSAAWTDYKVEAKVRLASASDYPGGLRGRVNPATGESYAAWIYPAEGVIKLFRAAAWNIDTAGLELLAQASVGTIAPDVWHTLAITFQGSSLTVTWNGSAAIQTTDSVLAAGAVALDVSNQPIDFDDVTVTQLGAGNPPPRRRYRQRPGRTDPGDQRAGQPVHPLRRRDPARRGAQRVRDPGDLDVTRRGASAATTSAILGETAADRRPGDDAHRLGQRRRQPDRHAPRSAARRAARPDRRGLDPRERLPAGRHRRAPGQGLVDQTIQFHGAADLYTLNGATAIATLYSNATTATTNPAVTLRSVGSAAARRRPSPTTSRARSSTPGRATRPGPARSATASRRSAPTTSSSAPRPAIRSPTGSISTRWPSRRPTSSSACWRT